MFVRQKRVCDAGWAAGSTRNGHDDIWDDDVTSLFRSWRSVFFSSLESEGKGAVRNGDATSFHASDRLFTRVCFIVILDAEAILADTAWGRDWTLFPICYEGNCESFRM